MSGPNVMDAREAREQLLEENVRPRDGDRGAAVSLRRDRVRDVEVDLLGGLPSEARQYLRGEGDCGEDGRLEMKPQNLTTLHTSVNT